MRILNSEEGEAWFVTAGRSEHVERVNFDEPRVTQYHVPTDAGRKMSLARLLIEHVYKERIIGLMIREHGIWETAESEFIFLKYREAVSQSCSLDDYPFHVSEIGCDPNIFGILVLSLYFYWGVDLLDERGEIYVTISHDEIFEVSFRDPALLTEFVRTAASYGLEKTSTR